MALTQAIGVSPPFVLSGPGQEKYNILTSEVHSADCFRDGRFAMIHHDDSARLKLLCARLRLDLDSFAPRSAMPVSRAIIVGTTFATHEGNNVVYTFVVAPNGEAVTLTDDALLFPSDALVAQIRMISA